MNPVYGLPMQYIYSFLYPVLYLLIKKIKKKFLFGFLYDVFRSLKGEKKSRIRDRRS